MKTKIKDFTLTCGKILLSLLIYNSIIESSYLMILDMQDSAYGTIDRMNLFAIILILPISAFYTRSYFTKNNKLWLSTLAASTIIYGYSKIIHNIDYHGTLITICCIAIIIIAIIKLLTPKEEHFLDENEAT